MRKCFCPLLLAAMLPASALAADYTLHLPRQVDISGTSVNFDGSVTYSVPDQACAPIALKVYVPLDDLNAKLTQIIRSTGIEKNVYCGEKLEIHGAHLSAEGGNIAAKVEGKVGRQQCLKVMHKVVGSTTIDSNVSIEAAFDPVIQDNALSAQLLGEPKVNISNDILRGLAQLFELDNKVENKLRDSIQQALAAPGAALQLPTELAGFQFTFDDAAVDTVDGRLTLVISGTSPRNQNLIPKFFGFLGSATGSNAPAASPCP